MFVQHIDAFWIPPSSKTLPESMIQSHSRKYSQNTWSWIFYFSIGHVITYFINYVILANLKFAVFLLNFSYVTTFMSSKLFNLIIH